MSFTIHKLTSRIGARIDGLDLTAEPDFDTTARLRAALHEHKALVFADTGLDHTAHERFASWFGQLTTAHPNLPAADGTTNVLPVDAETSKANAWHSDVTFIVNPPQATTLHSVVTTPYGGETLVANAATAYQDLPAPLRTLADSLWAVHTNQYDYVRPPAKRAGQRELDEIFVSVPYEAEHPVVRVHPLTGERGLFIGGFVKHLIGLSLSESTEILNILQSYVTRPENVLRWSWEPDQLLIFDNRSTQHYAIDNYDDHPRRLNRVTIAGEVPAGIDGRRSRQIVGDAAHYTPQAAIESAADRAGAAA